MNKEVYGLVRDNIPEMIRKDGGYPILQVLPNNLFKLEVESKLKSKLEKLLDEKNVENFVDVYELLDTLASAYNIPKDKINSYKQDKLNIKGGYSNKYYLEKINMI